VRHGRPSREIWVRLYLTRDRGDDIGPFTGRPISGATTVVYERDAENPLVAARPAAGDQDVPSNYDYLGRRTEKAVYDWDSGRHQWEVVPTEVHRRVWSGRLMLLELDGSDDEEKRGQEKGASCFSLHQRIDCPPLSLPPFLLRIPHVGRIVVFCACVSLVCVRAHEESGCCVYGVEDRRRS
jgi:hypothetical protein